MGSPARSQSAMLLSVASNVGSKFTSTAHNIGRRTQKLSYSSECKCTWQLVSVRQRLCQRPQISLRGLLKLGRIFEDDIVHVRKRPYPAVTREGFVLEGRDTNQEGRQGSHNIVWQSTTCTVDGTFDCGRPFPDWQAATPTAQVCGCKPIRFSISGQRRKWIPRE